MSENLTGKLVKFRTHSWYAKEFPLESGKFGTIIGFGCLKTFSKNKIDNISTGYIVFSFSRSLISNYTFSNPEQTNSNEELVEKIK